MNLQTVHVVRGSTAYQGLHVPSAVLARIAVVEMLWYRAQHLHRPLRGVHRFWIVYAYRVGTVAPVRHAINARLGRIAMEVLKPTVLSVPSQTLEVPS
jgi:hypothetical protein